MRSWRSTLLWSIGVALGLGLAACSGKSTPETVVEPPPPADQVVRDVRLEDNLLAWETVGTYRPYVRYGTASGDYTHVAYPAADDRVDRGFRTEHSVPLLDLTAGQPVFVQVVLERSTDGQLVVDQDREFTPNVNKTEGVMTSTMIHIGWGDAHLITMPNGTRMLIDAGDRGGGAAVVEYFEDHGIPGIDVALATHVHADHIGGMVGDSSDDNDGVLERFPPQYFLDSPSKIHFRSLYPETLDVLTQEGIERVVVSRGDSDANVPALALDPSVGIVVLNSGFPPDQNPRGGESGEGTNINNESIVLRFSYGDVDWVIGGDAEVEAEASILAWDSGRLARTEYYKAHHHGRFDGSSLNFLRALEPRITLIPVSSQEYSGGLPDYLSSTNPALGRILSVESHYYVIDDIPTAALERSVSRSFNYNVTFATDGVSYEVRAEIAGQTTKSSGVHRCEDHPPQFQNGATP